MPVVCLRLCIFYILHFTIINCQMFTLKKSWKTSTVRPSSGRFYYCKPWFTSTHSLDSAANDFELLKKLITNYECIQKTSKPQPNLFQQFVKTAREKFKNHLWYFTARLVQLSFFSDYVTSSEKHQIGRVLIKHRGETSTNKQEMPLSSRLEQTFLKSFVGQLESVSYSCSSSS